MADEIVWTIKEFAELAPRDIFGKVMIDLGKENKNIVALAPDMVLTTRLKDFSEKFPERFFETGITEQATIGMAAGMATCGLIPFFVTFACFASMRITEQIRTDICYPNLNVKIIGSHSGVSGGSMGTTHHSTEDIAIMRSLANMTVLVPSDTHQLLKVLRSAVEHEGPCYIRYIRGEGSPLLLYESVEKCPFEIGKGIMLKDGDDLTIIACGNPMVQNAFVAANELEKEKISVRVIDMGTVKPIDREIIIKAANDTKGIITVEDHNIIGGLGSAVAEVLVEEKPLRMKRSGIPDVFSAIGPPDELWKRYGLDSDSIAQTAKDFMNEIS